MRAIPFTLEILPRVRLAIRFFPAQERPLSVAELLDTGAEMSVFDGALAHEAGWSCGEIVERAMA